MFHSCSVVTDGIIFIYFLTFCFILWNTEICGCQDHCTEYNKHARCDVCSQMFWIMCIYFICISSPSFIFLILRIQFSFICNGIFSNVCVVLCFVHRASLYNLANKANIVHSLFLVYSSISTCFSRLCAHHEEKQLCLCDLWYLLFCVDDCLVCRSMCSCIPDSHKRRVW